MATTYALMPMVRPAVQVVGGPNLPLILRNPTTFKADGTLTVTGGTGATAFSVTQAATLANGKFILLGGTQYTVSAFNGTNACTLLATTGGAAAPNQSNSTFNIFTGAKNQDKDGVSPVLKFGPRDYRMFLEEHNTSDYAPLTNFIGYATSPDNFNWSINQTAIIDPLTNWENGEVCFDTVFWNPDYNQFWAYYHGGNNPPGNRQIGLMTSPTAQPGTWTRGNGGNPIIANGGSGAIDERSACDITVFRRSSTDYRAFYRAINISGISCVAYATSTDGKAWTKQGAVFSIGTGNDVNDVYGEWSYEDELGRVHMWYVGEDSGGNGRILYAFTDNWGTSWTRNQADVILYKSGTSTDSDGGGVADMMRASIDDGILMFTVLNFNIATYTDGLGRLEGRGLYWLPKLAAVQPVRPARAIMPIIGTGRSYLSVPTGASLLSQNTAFSIWFDFRQLPGSTYRVFYIEANAFNNELKVAIDGSGNFDCWMRKPTGSTTGIAALATTGGKYIGDNQWHRALMRRTAAGAWALLVDGVQVATSSETCNAADVTPTFFNLLGSDPANTDWPTTSFDGIGGLSRRMVTIAGYAMTNAEEAALWNNGNDGGAIPTGGTLQLNLRIGSGGQAGPDVNQSGTAYSVTVNGPSSMVDGQPIGKQAWGPETVVGVSNRYANTIRFDPKYRARRNMAAYATYNPVTVVSVALAGVVSAGARLLGATVTQTQPLVGTARSGARLPGAPLAQTQPLAGTTRSTARLTGALGQTQSIAGTARSSPRLTGTLGQSQAVAGIVRALARLTGTLGQSQSITGTTRSGARLTGAALAQSQPITGTARSGARLTGASLLQSLPLAGTLRSIARLIGNLNVTAPGSVAIAGTTRVLSRLLGLSVTQTIPLTGKARALTRTQGVLTQTIPIAGTTRATSRLTGLLAQSVAIGGIVRAGARNTGVTVLQSVAVRGVGRGMARLFGALDALVAGTVRAKSPTSVTVTSSPTSVTIT